MRDEEEVKEEKPQAAAVAQEEEQKQKEESESTAAAPLQPKAIPTKTTCRPASWTHRSKRGWERRSSSACSLIAPFATFSPPHSLLSPAAHLQAASLLSR